MWHKFKQIKMYKLKLNKKNNMVFSYYLSYFLNLFYYINILSKFMLYF